MTWYRWYLACASLPRAELLVAGHRKAWSSNCSVYCFVHCKLTNAGWRELLRGHRLQHILAVDARNKFRMLPWKCWARNFFLDTQEIVARNVNVVRWNVLHSLSLTSVPRARCCHVAFTTLWIAQCLYTFSDSALRFTCGRRPKQFDASTYNNGCLDKQNPTAITPDARAGIKLQVKTRVWTHDTHGFDASKQSSDRNVLVNDLLGIGLNSVATTITYNHTRKDVHI